MENQEPDRKEKNLSLARRNLKIFQDLTDSPSHGRKMGHTSKNGSHLNSRHLNFDQEMTTSMREPTTCVWIPANIFRQDGGVWSKNSKIVPYHSCARILTSYTVSPHVRAKSSTLCNMSLKLATLKFFVRQVACGDGNTGNKALQLAEQQCCTTSCEKTLPYYLTFNVSAHPYCARKFTCHVMHRAGAKHNCYIAGVFPATARLFIG